MKARRTGLCAALLSLAACEREPPVDLSASLAARLPASCGMVLAWHEPLAAHDPLLQALLARTGSWSSMLDPLRETIGALGILRRAGAGPDDGREAVVAIARAESEAAARRIAAVQPPAGHELRANRELVQLRPTRPVGNPVGLLGDESWFRATVRGLGAREAGVSGFVDLRRVRREARVPGRSIGRDWMRYLPGLSSLLHAGVHARRKGETGGSWDFEVFLQLARTPVGIPKALAAAPAELGLPSLFLPLESSGGYVVQRLEAQVLIDSLQLLLGGGSALVPDPTDMLRSLRGGFLFQRAFWRSFDREWAVLLPRRRELCLLVRVRDRAGLVRTAEELARDPPLGFEIDLERAAGVLRAGVRAFRWRGVAVLGREFAALAPASQQDLLETMLRREREGGLATTPLPGFPGGSVPREVTGAGHLPRGLRLLPAPLDDADLAWWVTRERGGLKFSGTLRR